MRDEACLFSHLGVLVVNELPLLLHFAVYLKALVRCHSGTFRWSPPDPRRSSETGRRGDSDDGDGAHLWFVPLCRGMAGRWSQVCG